MIKKIKPNKKAYPERSPRVVVAMSGGVDSSVAAALLKRAGVDVVGVFMKFWQPPSGGGTRIRADNNADLRGYENRCCSTESEKRARKVAEILGIPFYVLNAEKEFKKKVVDYFLSEYKKGNTPNPCVVCNKEIKFGFLIRKALSLDADFVATGHYARLRREILNPKSQFPNNAHWAPEILNHKTIKLFRAKDGSKDQSYFLWQLNQKQLGKILFPVGNYTKIEIRKLAKKLKLPTATTPESQEVCFVQNTTNEFLKKYLKQNPGQIIDVTGKVLGWHNGLWFYTIGQRRGLEIPQGPYYAVSKDFKNNILVASKDEKDLLEKELLVKNVNWISGKESKLPLAAQVKIRYKSKSGLATISKIQDTRYKIQFSVPQRAVTAGQSVVFYKGKELLGGGIIE